MPGTTLPNSATTIVSVKSAPIPAATRVRGVRASSTPSAAKTEYTSARFAASQDRAGWIDHSIDTASQSASPARHASKAKAEPVRRTGDQIVAAAATTTAASAIQKSRAGLDP